MKYPLRQLAHFAELDGRRVGIVITCPNCGTHLYAPFRNPIGGGASTAEKDAGWQRVGDTLKSLTLTPMFDPPGHFRSRIRDGELELDSPSFSCKNWKEANS